MAVGVRRLGVVVHATDLPSARFIRSRRSGDNSHMPTAQRPTPLLTLWHLRAPEILLEELRIVLLRELLEQRDHVLRRGVLPCVARLEVAEEGQEHVVADFLV